MKETNNKTRLKLNLDQIKELKQKRNNGETIEKLARTYGISRMSVYNYLGTSSNKKLNNSEYQRFLPSITKNLRDKFLYG
jgi:DNA invertase Pin-like site-specific DNA recombinase